MKKEGLHCSKKKAASNRMLEMPVKLTSIREEAIVIDDLPADVGTQTR